MTSLSPDNWVSIFSYFEPDLTLSWLLTSRLICPSLCWIINNNHSNFLKNKLGDWNFYFNDSGVKKFYHKSNLGFITDFYQYCYEPVKYIQWMNKSLLHQFKSFTYIHIHGNFYKNFGGHLSIQNEIIQSSFEQIKDFNFIGIKVRTKGTLKTIKHKDFESPTNLKLIPPNIKRLNISSIFSKSYIESIINQLKLDELETYYYQIMNGNTVESLIINILDGLPDLYYEKVIHCNQLTLVNKNNEKSYINSRFFGLLQKFTKISQTLTIDNFSISQRRTIIFEMRSYFGSTISTIIFKNCFVKAICLEAFIHKLTPKIMILSDCTFCDDTLEIIKKLETNYTTLKIIIQ